jgi:hypothetical protein
MQSAPGTIRNMKVALEVHPELQDLNDSLTKYNPNGSDTFTHILRRIDYRLEYQYRRLVSLDEVGESGLDGGMYAVFEFNSFEDFTELLPRLQKLVSEPLCDFDIISPNS